MKITKKQLSKLIETFIVGPEGGAIDMGTYALKRSSHNLESLLDPYDEKIINHPAIAKLGFEEKLKTLLNTGNIKDKLSAYMIAKSLKLISKQEHDEIRKIVSDMKKLELAKDLKKNPPKDMAIGYPGKKVYRTEEGELASKKYAVYQAQRDDPNFEQTLSQRIRELIPDLKRFVTGIYNNYGDPTVYDWELIEEVVKTITEMLKQKHGKIYTTGNIYMVPAVEKALYEDFGLRELVFELSSKREEYAQYLDNTDLNKAVHDILDNIIDDTPVDDVLKQLKSLGYDENFYKKAFQDMQGRYVIPNFDPNTYENMMEYYLHDYLRYEDFVDILGISDGVIYRMR